MNMRVISVAVSLVILVVVASWFLPFLQDEQSSMDDGPISAEGHSGSGSRAEDEGSRDAASRLSHAVQGAGDDRHLSNDDHGAATARNDESDTLSGEAPAHTAPLANPYLKSLAEARDGRFPERRSLHVRPQPFNLSAFTDDPDRYVYTIEPGRAFQSANPGPDTPAIHPVGHSRALMQHGESVVMTVSAAPNMPVSWLCLHGGTFAESTVNAVTVLADADGQASVNYLAGHGTINEAMVIASSPVCSGQATFTVFVQPTSQQ